MAFESPLITGEGRVTPADLIFACQVCAEEPIGELSSTDGVRLRKMESDPVAFNAAISAFSTYILVNNWPKFWEQTAKKSGGSKGVPWPLAVVASLIVSGIKEKRAWEMPECQAIWLNSALAISKGADVSIMSPEEEAFMVAEEAAEAASNLAKVKP